MLQHQPDGHGALYALPYVTRFLPTSCLRPRPVPAGRGPLFYLHPGRSPESQAKERQQRQDDDAFHGGQPLYPCGSMRRVSAWSDRVTDICVQRAGCDGNKKAVRRRQALNAKIPPMPGGKGGMKTGECQGINYGAIFYVLVLTYGAETWQFVFTFFLTWRHMGAV